MTSGYNKSEEEVVKTGGLKEFHITREDRARWESEKTEFSLLFKKALETHRTQRRQLEFKRQYPIKYWFKNLFKKR